MLRNLAAFAALSGAAAAFYGHRVEPERIEITHTHLALERLAPAFHGYRLAQISDIHMGSGMTAARLHRIVDRVNAQQPDLIVVTGDYITYRIRHRLEDLVNPLRRLHAPDGVITVPGNHDYKADGAIGRVRAVMAACDMIDVSNSYHTLRRGDAMLHIAGLDDVAARESRLDLLLRALPEAGSVVLLVHEPDFADIAAPTGRFDLQLSGHSHAGQIRIPVLWRFATPVYGRRYPGGFGEVAGLPLYVNRGIGTVGLPMRINCRPEISMFTLHTPPDF